jgi:hypothetical protein
MEIASRKVSIKLEIALDKDSMVSNITILFYNTE